ncbi:kinase-like domain-containing protein [Scleroderma citrinum]
MAPSPSMARLSPPRDLTGLLRKLDGDAFAHGSSTDIWKGEWKTPPPGGSRDGFVAIKVIRAALAPDRVEELSHVRYNLTDSLALADIAPQKLKREAHVWASLKDPNIVPLLGIVVLDVTPTNVPSLVSPYYKNGNLKSYMKQHRTGLSSSDMLNMTYQFASGLDYLHRSNVVHGDLKPDNLLINDRREVVISDFGLSRVLETTGFTTKNFYGAVRYTAPEILDYTSPSGSSKYIPKTLYADIWAFAITSTEVPRSMTTFGLLTISLQIFSSKQPYENKNDSTVLQYVKIKKGRLEREHYKQEISETLWSMFERCWQYEPSERPRMHMIKKFLEDKKSKPIAR